MSKNDDRFTYEYWEKKDGTTKLFVTIDNKITRVRNPDKEDAAFKKRQQEQKEKEREDEQTK